MFSKISFPLSKLLWIITIYAILLPNSICRSGVNLSSAEKALVWLDGSGRGYNATTYYVSSSGNDNDNGTSEESAFKTIARALQVVAPGGTVFIFPGTYREGIVLLNFGSSEGAITIAGFKGMPTLNGNDQTPISLFAEKCTNLIFQNLEIKNYTDIGIGASKCTGIKLQNLIVTENGHSVKLLDWELEGYGIYVEDSKNVTIINNNVSRNGPSPQIFPDRLMGTGIDTFHNQNVVIKGNRSYENIGGGILVEDSVFVIVEDNKVYRNDLDASVDAWWDGGIWLDGGRDVIIRNNIFRDNLGPGIQISDEDIQHPTGYILENNVSTGNYYGIFIWNFGTTVWPTSSILRHRGNQITGNTRQDIWIEAWLCSEDQPCE